MRRRRSRGSSVVCVRSPVKITKSGVSLSAFTDATAFGSVPRASGFGGPSKPQWLSESWTKKKSWAPALIAAAAAHARCARGPT